MQLSHKIKLRSIILHHPIVVHEIFVKKTELFKIKENKRNNK
jgi:hypothetical protein